MVEIKYKMSNGEEITVYSYNYTKKHIIKEHTNMPINTMIDIGNDKYICLWNVVSFEVSEI